MFKQPLNQDQKRELRFNREAFQQERLQPDRSRYAGWFRMLKRILEQSCFEAQPQAVVPELFVPDGCMALHILDGRPDRWFQPGRHQLSAAKAKVEVRLVLANLVQDQDRVRLELALQLPFERALLFVDGLQVAIVKPENSRERQPLGAVVQENPAPLKPRPEVSAEEEEPFQDFSFV
jgi:hypothetical protein